MIGRGNNLVSPPYSHSKVRRLSKYSNDLHTRDKHHVLICNTTIYRPAPVVRSARQLLYAGGGQPPMIQTAWMLRDGNNCVTAKGHIGTCTTYRSCYPYFKIPDLTIWESWILGNYDTCSFFNDDGRQTFGVCCSNPISAPVAVDMASDRDEGGVTPQSSTSTSTTMTTHTTAKPIIETAQKDNNYPNWPPPVPTHPPDHAAPTHPTSSGSALVTTSRPIPVSTTWPTKATQAPTVAQWPPALPTHAPPVLGGATVSSTTETAIDNNEIDVQFATCGAKNGNPVG